MYIALESTKKINSFEDVVIPRPRELYARYGARESLSGLYLSDGDIGEVMPLAEGSVISQLTRAQDMLQRSFDNSNEAQRNEIK